MIQQGRVILQGTPSKEARGPENGDIFKYFHLHVSWACSINSDARKEYTLHISASNWVRAGSPPRGGDIVVYVFDINHPSLSIPFYSVLESLSTVFDSYIFRQLSAFLLCSSGIISALLVLSTISLFMKVSLSRDIILVIQQGRAIL